MRRLSVLYPFELSVGSDYKKLYDRQKKIIYRHRAEPYRTVGDSRKGFKKNDGYIKKQTEIKRQSRSSLFRIQKNTEGFQKYHRYILYGETVY